jgi:hypothetical protein
MGMVCSTHGEKRNLYRNLVEKPEGKKPVGRPRCRWEDNIRWTLEINYVVLWTELISLKIGTIVGLL